jgi:GDP-4-dehydro-6-deoxy-D-mannose reductase
MTRRVLITGITGFIGRYLASYLTVAGDRVWGFKRPRSDASGLPASVQLIEGDILDYHSVLAAVRREDFDCIFHLAAQSYPSVSWDAPRLTMDTNVTGTLNLLEAVRALRNSGRGGDGGTTSIPRILIPGSAAQYGVVTRINPVFITESTPFRPSSPYGVSKVAQEMLGFQYHHAHGIPVLVTRSFIHTGIGQGDRCVLQAFCKQQALIEAGMQKGAILFGNLKPVRDFLDVRDAVRAFDTVMRRGKPGEAYNVGSGNGFSIRELLRMVSPEADPSRIPDPLLTRPFDEPSLVADIFKLARLDWKPEYNLDETVAAVLAYWRRKVASE